MAVERRVVEGVKFTNASDYEAALRDQAKIESIRKSLDLNDKNQIIGLYRKLQGGEYHFESIIGDKFDDEIYEKFETLKNIEKKQPSSVPGEKHRKNRKNFDTKPEGVRADSDNSRNTSSLKYDEEIERQARKELVKKEKRRKKIIWIAALVAVLSFGYFGVYNFYSIRTQSDYQELANLIGSESLASDKPESNKLVLHKEAVSLPDVLDEYKTLYAKNKKLIGWLKIADTKIDYPVMQTSDNEYYLEHNYNQEYDKNGSLFMDCNCIAYPKSTNIIIYGHHMKSGNMFGNLQKYANESYGKKHSTIYFDTIYEKGTYELLYVFRSQVYNENDAVFKYYQFVSANSAEEFDYYMNEMSKLTLYNTGISATYGDQLLTLSTCDSSATDGRFVVVAKRVY